MAAIWAYLVVDPLILFLTIFFGSLNIAVSFLDSKGHVQMWMARTWARCLLFVSGVRVRAEGLDKIDLSKPYVIASNHASYMDTPVILTYIRLQFRFMAKEELFKIPFLGTHLKTAGHVSVPRSDPRAAVRTMNEAAENIRVKGISMLIFPEGGRTRTGELQDFKEGVASIAIKAGVPIVPVGLTGTRAVVPMGSAIVKPGRVTLRVGEPIPTEGMNPKDRGALTAKVRESIASLIG
ncbi:1-acyl-sn-glycerol-3-phosphate acyltransferase [Bryobacterales bacterium F-183]|nr:1-acyl-sn-glycerol-3-phosphate acyltransferase [Bryobacterales bacterium F-183]